MKLCISKFSSLQEKLSPAVKFSRQKNNGPNRPEQLLDPSVQFKVSRTPFDLVPKVLLMFNKTKSKEKALVPKHFLVELHIKLNNSTQQNSIKTTVNMNQTLRNRYNCQSLSLVAILYCYRLGQPNITKSVTA